MNQLLRYLFVSASLGFGAIFAFADEAPPAPAPADTTTAVANEPEPAATQDLVALIEKIKAKIQAGPVSEAVLADELKGFDAILAKYAGEKTDAVAEVLVGKAMVYVSVLEDPEKALEVFKQLKAEFPETKWGKQADEAIREGQRILDAKRVAESLKPGAVFPEFEVTDLEGQPLSLARFKGKLVLIDFWATWCGPCVEELPNVVAAYKKYHERGFEVIGVSLDKDEAELKSFLKEHEMVWPQFFDGQGWGNALAAKYSVQSIPATFLVDGEGKIVAKDLRGEALEAELARRLEKK